MMDERRNQCAECRRIGRLGEFKLHRIYWQNKISVKSVLKYFCKDNDCWLYYQMSKEG